MKSQKSSRMSYEVLQADWKHCAQMFYDVVRVGKGLRLLDFYLSG